MKQILALPDNPFSNKFVIPQILYVDTRNRYCPVDVKFINEKTLFIFKKLNLEIGGIIVFKKHTNGISPVHTDILFEKDEWSIWNCAVNYNLTGARSKMMWFETSLEQCYPINSKMHKSTDYILSGIHYGKRLNADYTSSSFKLIDEEEIIKPTLVRTDVPHTTINLDDKDRICASIRFKINYSFNELLEKFKEMLV